MIDITRKKLSVWIYIVIIFSFAFVPRYLAINEGLPYMHYWDEPKCIVGALNGMKYDNFLPQAQEAIYGGFLRYSFMAIDFVYLQFLKMDPESGVQSLYDVHTGYDTRNLSHEGFAYYNRMFVGALSSLAFVLVFLIIRMRFGSLAGLIGVLVLSLEHNHFFYHYTGLVDVPMSFWAITTLYFSLKYVRTIKARDIVFSLVAAGIAMSTKISGLFILVIPATAILLNLKHLMASDLKGNIKKALFLGLVPVITFMAINPISYINLKGLYKWIAHNAELYKDGTGHLTKEPGWDNLSYQIELIVGNLGLPFVILAALGILIGMIQCKNIKVSLKNSDMLLIAIYPLFHLFYMTTYKIAYHRNFLFLYPYIAVLSTYAIGYIVEFVNRFTKRTIKYSYHLLFGIVTILVFVNGLPVYKVIYNMGIYNSKKVETRTQAAKHIESLKGEGPVFVGVDRNLKMSHQDLRESGLKFGYFELVNVDKALKGFTHLMIPEYDFDTKEFEVIGDSTIADYDSTLRDNLLHSINGSKINVAHKLIYGNMPLINPSVKILKGSNYPPPNMSDYKLPLFHLDYISLPNSTPVRVIASYFEPGKYTFRFKALSYPALNEYPELLIRNRQDTLQKMTIANDKFDLVIVPFELKTEEDMDIYVQITNDLVDQATGQDRNLYIKEFEVYKENESQYSN